jgi:hypothetical protein
VRAQASGVDSRRSMVTRRVTITLDLALGRGRLTRGATCARSIAATVGSFLLVLVLPTLALGHTTSPGRLAAAVQNELVENPWPDNRIVAGATCVGTNAVTHGYRFYASRFVCRIASWTRPSSVSKARWKVLGDAMRTHDIQLVYTLLGLPANPTKAQVEAAAKRAGLGQARLSTAGIQPVTTTRWRVSPSPIPLSTFTASVNARYELMQIIPDVEAYYYDHRTYAGATITKLIAAYHVHPSVAIRIVTAAGNSYCVEADGGGTTWSEQGPGGAPNLRSCP